MSKQAPTQEVEHLLKQKTQWLLSQIDVAYPTRESVLGKACYLDLIEKFDTIDSIACADSSVIEKSSNIEWIRADFHKLTVLFARFMASHTDIAEASREYLQEFFAQIILDDQGEHSLCLGFDGSEVAGACIVSSNTDVLLVSDLLLKDGLLPENEIIILLKLFVTERNIATQSGSVFVQKFRYI